MKLTYIVLFCFLFSGQLKAQQKTYCNPVNIDYGYTPIPNFSEWGKHRATADPVIVNYKGDYYLFSTNQWGYWWSSDMLKWNFVSKKFLRPWNGSVYDELCGNHWLIVLILVAGTLLFLPMMTAGCTCIMAAAMYFHYMVWN